MAAAVQQSVFAGQGAGQKEGIEIWRIENMTPVPVDRSTYGSFYSGDCYIVLHSYKRNAMSNRLEMNVHFWLGKDSSQDERGAAALRTVELDDFLGGVPVQHREVQEHESGLFLSYFSKGLIYLDGGVDSAFVKVDRDAFSIKLFHLKGKRTVRSVQVELSAKQLNQGDVFILDNGMTIYQWNGSGANRAEKFKGLELVTKIKDSERGGKAKLVFLESTDSGAEIDEFFRLLGGSKDDVKPESEGGSDDAPKAEPASLWRISDASGAMEVTEVGRGKLTRSMLDDSDVFLLDGGGEVFVWVGKGATKAEREKGMSHGQDYLKKTNKPDWTKLTRLPGGGESPAFKSYFVQFDKEHIPQNAEEEYVAKERKLELGILLQKQKVATQKLADNGSGDAALWRIEGVQKIAVPKDQYGQFYSACCYICSYKYKAGNRDSYLLYFWIGRDATTDEKAACALLTVETAGEMGDLPGTQVRVVQNKEPQHFLSLFKDRMVVRTGKPAGVAPSGSHHSASSSSSSSAQLFHIRGTSAIDTRAVEVRPVAGSLNSGDCYVLLSGGSVWVWDGQGSSDDERALAATVAKNILAQGRPISALTEGAEPDEWWAALGGKAAYANDKHLQSTPHESRLFMINGNSANFTVEEVENYCQEDLDQQATFLLDMYSEVYVWVGQNARAADKDAALSIALQYVENAPDGRSKSTPIFRVPAGAEPPTFSANFRGWSSEKSVDFSDQYEKAKMQINGAGGMTAASAAAASAPAAAASPKAKWTPPAASPKPAAEPAPAAAGPAAASPAAAAKVSPATPTPAAVPAAAAKPAPAAAAPAPAAAPAAASGPASSPPSGSKFYTLAELKSGVPAGVEAAKKENYLSDADFKAALGTDREAFAKLAGWKQADIKKKAGIF